MRLQNKSLHFVVNFLLGVAWALALLGAVSAFLSFYPHYFFYAIVSAFIGTIPGFIAILILEHIISSKEKHLELQKQTKLLQLLLEKKDNQF